MKVKIQIIKDDKASGLKKGDIKKLDLSLANHLIKQKLAKNFKEPNTQLK